MVVSDKCDIVLNHHQGTLVNSISPNVLNFLLFWYHAPSDFHWILIILVSVWISRPQCHWHLPPCSLKSKQSYPLDKSLSDGSSSTIFRHIPAGQIYIHWLVLFALLRTGPWWSKSIGFPSYVPTILLVHLKLTATRREKLVLNNESLILSSDNHQLHYFHSGASKCVVFSWILNHLKLKCLVLYWFCKQKLRLAYLK